MSLWISIKKKTPNIAGWIGSLTILSAYIFHKSDIIKDSNILDIMNMFGSITVGYVCYLRKAWQPLFLNCSWFVVGMISLILNFEI